MELFITNNIHLFYCKFSAIPRAVAGYATPWTFKPDPAIEAMRIREAEEKEQRERQRREDERLKQEREQRERERREKEKEEKARKEVMITSFVD